MRPTGEGTASPSTLARARRRWSAPAGRAAGPWHCILVYVPLRFVIFCLATEYAILATPRATLPLENASSIVDRALELGREAGLLPLTVAVLDSGGHIVALKREDGAGIIRVEVAIGKAYGSLGMGVSSRTLCDRLADRSNFSASLGSASGGRVVNAPGGVLVCATDGIVVGAVGISGDTSDADEYCAIRAVASAGFQPEPPEPVPDWRRSKF